MDTATADSVIDAAIAGQATNQAAAGPNQGKVTPDDSSLFPSVTAPAPAEPPERSPEEQAIADQQRQLLGDDAADQLEKEQAEQEAREQTLPGQLEKLLNQGKGKTRAAGDWLGKVPTGNLTTPLIILGILFLLLVTYNGNTRFQWIWLVLTGNAYVTDQGTDAGSPAPTPQPGEPASEPAPTPQPGEPQGGGTFSFEALALPMHSVNGNYGGNPFS